MIKLTDHVARTLEKENAYRNLVWKPEGNNQLGRPRNKEENNIEIKLEEIGLKGVNWINLSPVKHQWKAFLNTEMKLQVLYNRKIVSVWENLSFSWMTLIDRVGLGLLHWLSFCLFNIPMIYKSDMHIIKDLTYTTIFLSVLQPLWTYSQLSTQPSTHLLTYLPTQLAAYPLFHPRHNLSNLIWWNQNNIKMFVTTAAKITTTIKTRYKYRDVIRVSVTYTSIKRIF
jgi:hypothetical protein